jgi:hypothetical protein
MKLGWRSPRAFYAAVAFALTTAFFSFGSYANCRYKIESDGKYYYHFLLSAWFDQDLDFTNNYRAPTPAFMGQPVDHYQFAQRINPATHRPTNVFTCGLAVMWTPFFAAARAAVAITDFLRPGTLSPDPWSRFHQYAVTFSAVLYVTLALAMLSDVWRRWQGAPMPRWALLLTLCATPLCYYTVFEASMSHAYDCFTLTLILWLLVRGRDAAGWRPFVALGLACALHILVRTQNLVTVAIVAAVVLPYWQIVARRAFAGYALLFGLIAAGAAVPLAINRYLFGAFLVVPQTISFRTPFIDPWHPKLVEVLFSNRNGWFSQHPALLVAAVGCAALLVELHRRAAPERWVVWGLCAAFAGQVYVNSTVLDWWAGSSFGQRRLVALLPLFALGFAWPLSRAAATGARRWVNAVAGATVLAGVYLMFIHVFLWDYAEPHNIWSWMFVRAPRMWLAALGKG